MLSHYVNVFLEKYHQRRGLRLIRRSQYKKAAYHFERALLLGDSVANFYYYSVSLISLNKHAQAISYLEKIVENHSDDILISTTLAECYLVVREWVKAEDFLSFLNDKFKDNIVVRRLFDISKDLILREKYATSKEYFFKAIELLDSKKIEEALTNAQSAIELDELNSSYYFLAGVILMQGKRAKAEVEGYLEKAVLLAPQNEGYKKQLRAVKTSYDF